MKCRRCGGKISEDDCYQYSDETLCEDCYLDLRYPVKACDPWAVYSATRLRKSQGLKGADGLTELQKAIHEFVKSKGKATREEIKRDLGLSESEMQTHPFTIGASSSSS